MKGTVPVTRANQDNLTTSTAGVAADIRQADTGLIFATQALKSATVLDADRFPLARFQSTRMILGPDNRISNGAIIEGRLTPRDMTRPVRYDAGLYRPTDTEPEDLRNLIIAFSTTINRHDYGASTYSYLVNDFVDIDARISAIG